MRRCRPIFIWLILLLLPVCAFPQPPAPKSAPPAPSTLGNLRVSLLEGDVQIKTVDLGDWAPASINIPLKEVDELWVPEAGRVEVQIMPATYVRLDQNSSLAVVTVTKGAEQVYLSQGRAYVNFNPGREGTIQFDTPISSIQVFGRGVFKVDVTEDGSTDVSVLDGTVYVEGKAGKTTVAGGNMLSLKGETDAEMAPMSPGDDWENWNVERDKRVFTRRESVRYLPGELHGYANDFDDNGKWVSVPEYGQVWVPTVVVAAEWAPYRVGRWTWIGGDYVWVSLEPWGWAHHHYGRWAHHAHHGWFWIPPVAREVYWGPGYVGWVNTPTHVAWVPLAPREIYYGYGYFGPHSVNLHRHRGAIDTIRVTHVYRNIHVHDGITIIRHDTFVRGHGWGGRIPDRPHRFIDAGFRGNPFLEHRIHAGRPLIKPERSTMISIHKEITINRHPPQRIREVNISKIKETRHIVRDRNVSAFTPGARTRDLSVRQREGVRRGEPRKVVDPGGKIRTGGPGGPVGPREKIDRGVGGPGGPGGPKERIDRGTGGPGGPVGPREKVDRGVGGPGGPGGPKERIDRGTGGPGGPVGPREKIDRGPKEKVDRGPKEKVDRGPKEKVD